MVVEYTAHKHFLLHTKLAEHPGVLEQNHFQVPFFSQLSDAVYPTFSASFWPEIHPHSQNLVKVLSLQHRGDLFLMIGFLLVSV